MIYLSRHTPTLVTINDTTDNHLVFTNNQTQRVYEIDLRIVGIGTSPSRRQISFLLEWGETPDEDTPTAVIDGANRINVIGGEYNYQIGDCKGLMILKEEGKDNTIYRQKQTNIVYNG